MEKEFRTLMEKSKETLEKIEKRLEEGSEDLSEDAKAYWSDLKSYLGNVGKKLQNAYDSFEGEAELKTHLFLMEARERLEDVKDDMDSFLASVTRKSEKELDIMALKAHLAKLEAEDKWEEKEKEFSHLYAKSKVEAEKLVQKASKEINDIFLKLTEIV